MAVLCFTSLQLKLNVMSNNLMKVYHKQAAYVSALRTWWLVHFTKNIIGGSGDSLPLCFYHKQWVLENHFTISAHRTETLHVKSLRGGRGGHPHLRSGAGHGHGHVGIGGAEARLEYTEVNLSSELFLAPEMMYASLDLVGMIVDAAQDLPSQYLKDCFSHILIQGK